MIKRLIRLILFIILVGGIITWVLLAVKNREININQWFVSGQVMGVDVSSYQEDVDFLKLMRQGVRFAYIKATEGVHQDDSFAQKWADARDTEMLAGAYHYYNYHVSGAEQAANFIATVGELDGRLIPAVDMELTAEEVQNPPAKDAVVTGLTVFLAILEEKYGVKPLIYAAQDYWDKYLKDDFSDYPRWVRNVYYPAYLGAGEDWYVWQYNDRGELDGYAGEKYIDLDVVNSRYGLEVLKMP